MSRSNEASNYFQTDESVATIERKAAKAKNEHGNPIKVQSKLLAVVLDHFDDRVVYVAEAAGDINRVDLETNEGVRLQVRASAPLTCLTLSQSGRLYAGCWNKQIYSANTTRASTATNKVTLNGHTDFVKCLLATSINGRPILISGGADAVIIVWDLVTAKPLHKLKGHTKALQDLALDPLSLPIASQEPEDSFVVFTASSDREIRRWHISLDNCFELLESVEKPILAHETSVYKLHVDSEGDLWTASADKTAKHLVRSRGWEADTVLQHPDFVRDIVVSEAAGLVVTACRDEEVRVWDAGSGGLVCTYSGHYEEVTGLALRGERTVVSVSIDGTVRQWPLDKREMARYLEELNREDVKEKSTAGAAGDKSAVLTAEEEAELAELMDDEE